MRSLKKRLQEMEEAVAKRDADQVVYVDVYEDRVVSRNTGEEFDLEMLYHLATMNPDVVFIPFVQHNIRSYRPELYAGEGVTPDAIRAENAGGPMAFPEPEDPRTPAEQEAEMVGWAFWDEMIYRMDLRRGFEPQEGRLPWPYPTTERDKEAEEDLEDEVDDD